MNLWWCMTLLWTRIFGRSTSNWSATNNIGDKKWNRSSQLTSCKTIDKRHLSSWTSMTCCRMDRSKPPWNHRHLSCHPAETFGNFHRDQGTTACKCFMSVISLLIFVLSIWRNLKTIAVAVAMKTTRLSTEFDRGESWGISDPWVWRYWGHRPAVSSCPHYLYST